MLDSDVFKNLFTNLEQTGMSSRNSFIRQLAENLGQSRESIQSPEELLLLQNAYYYLTAYNVQQVQQGQVFSVLKNQAKQTLINQAVQFNRAVQIRALTDSLFAKQNQAISKVYSQNISNLGSQYSSLIQNYLSLRQSAQIEESNVMKAAQSAKADLGQQFASSGFKLQGTYNSLVNDLQLMATTKASNVYKDRINQATQAADQASSVYKKLLEQPQLREDELNTLQIQKDLREF